MKALAIAAAVAAFATLSPVCHSAPACSEPKLESLPESHPECQFYKGTRLFREKRYSEAGQQWQLVLESSGSDPATRDLLQSAHNNLGYLLYMGLGTDVDRVRAIEHWQIAAQSGHEESQYHLCHALGDFREPEYQPQVALPHCRRALSSYLRSAEQDENIGVIVRTLKQYISELEGA